MSVSPCLEGLQMRTPTKKVVEGDINAWMETQNKENRHDSNHRPKLYKIKNTEVLQRKIPSRQYPGCEHITRQLRSSVVMKERQILIAPKSGRSIELITPRINCKLSLEKGLNETKMAKNYPWSGKQSVRGKYKLKEMHFKNHLTNKSLEITNDILTPNQKLLIHQIVKKRQMQWRWR